MVANHLCNIGRWTETKWYEEHHYFIILDCPLCGDLVCVTRMPLEYSQTEDYLRSVMESSLRKMADRVYGVGLFVIDQSQSEDSSHYHVHARPILSNG